MLFTLRVKNMSEERGLFGRRVQSIVVNINENIWVFVS